MTYGDAAEKGFNRLVAPWNNAKPFEANNGGCFWMCGNTLHVALDYLIANTHKEKKRDKYNLSADALKLFDKKVTDKDDPKNWYKEGIWVDDYGWWGIALTRAYMFAEALGYNDLKNNDLKSNLAKYAKNCWTAMNTAWDPSAMQNDIPTVSISGGIWNSRPEDPKKPIKPGNLAGKNCVTNEVYWLLSHYLSVAMDDPQFMDPNTNEALWFSQAKTSNVLVDDKGLVLERFKGSPGGVKGPFRNRYTWLGDQGLFLYGCHTNSDPKALNLDRAQVEATIKAVSDNKTTKTTNKVLSEPLFSTIAKDRNGKPDPSFNLDYAGGKGIFIRNLAILNNHSHAGARGPTYDDWIMDNASAVWNNQLPNGNFHYWWEKKQDEDISWGYPQDVVDAVLHASGQSALTACIPYLENQPIRTTQSRRTAGRAR